MRWSLATTVYFYENALLNALSVLDYNSILLKNQQKKGTIKKSSRATKNFLSPRRNGEAVSTCEVGTKPTTDISQVRYLICYYKAANRKCQQKNNNFYLTRFRF